MMRLLTSLLLSVTVLGYNPEDDLPYDHYPKDLVWDAATAAYQIESDGTRTGRV